MKTAFILPVRDRVNGARRALESIRETVPYSDIFTIVVVSENMDTLEALMHRDIDRLIFHYPTSEQFSVHAWNMGAKLVEEDTDIIVPASTDVTYIPGWYEQMLSVYQRDRPQYLHLLDTVTGERAGLFHALNSAAFFLFDYNIYPPYYRGRYCDTELFDRAKQLNIVTRVPGICIRHVHPSSNTADQDLEYSRLDAVLEQDRITYETRKANGWTNAARF